MDSNELTTLADPDAWEGETLKDILAIQLAQGRLNLVLGAGVSCGFGLPGWDELVSRVAGALSCAVPPGLNNEQAGEYLLGRCSDDRQRFSELVRKALYRDADLSLSALIGRPLLVALGALSMASHRGSVPRLLSFNFDDLLETYLRYHGYVVRSIGEAPAWNALADVAVLHPHGLLPADPEKAGTPIVFAQSDYDAVVGKAHNAWRRAALEVLTTHTCVFIGLSGRDANLTSLLEEARDSHPGRRRGDAYWGVRFTDNPHDPLTSMWAKKQIKQAVVAPMYADLPVLLLDVCQRAANQFHRRQEC